MATPEGIILNAVCDYLALKKYFFWRQNTVPIFSEGRFRRMGKYTMRGTPDILLVKEGRLIGLECKTKKGVLSTYQKEFCDALRAAGGRYELIRSVDDVIKAGI